MFFLFKCMGFCFCAVLCWELLSRPAQGCTTVVVGKSVSATGEILIAHNEDTSAPLVMVQHFLSQRGHRRGELLSLEDGTAKISQDALSFSAYWSEVRAPYPGASYCDFFVNQWGVVITSDSCRYSAETDPDITQGGIGYGLRRVMAQRGRTAREALDVALELLNTYGYADSGRTYVIGDSQEVWILQVVQGKHYLAVCLEDDEVFFIPNHFTLRSFDRANHEKYILSPGLIEHALERGWYSPAREGDFSDFDFARAYQREDYFEHPRNMLRHLHGLSFLTDKDYDAAMDLPFTFRPNRPVGVEDLMQVLRSHYEGTSLDLTSPTHPSPHTTENRTICTATTQESFILQLRKNPHWYLLWRASGRPCTSVYVPWYPLGGTIPKAYGRLDSEYALATHFNPPAEETEYNPERAWWIFQDLQTMVDPDYRERISLVRNWGDALEREWLSVMEEGENKLRSVYEHNPQEGLQALGEATKERAARAMEEARDLIALLATHRVVPEEKEVERHGRSKVHLILVPLNKGDVGLLDGSSFRVGPYFARKEDHYSRALGWDVVICPDQNTQGLRLTFSASPWGKLTSPGKTRIVVEGKCRNGTKVVALGTLMMVG